MILLEREDLLTALETHLSSARSGVGSLALIAGEAGSGKTSVTKAFAEKATHGTLVMWGACDPLSTPRPLSPLLDMASEHDSGLGDILGHQADPMDTFGLVLERLRETVRPVVMVMEDIHWADDATLDFLRFIGRRVGSTKALVICTYRDDEVGPDHPLRVVLGQLIPLQTTTRLEVPPLTRSAVATLIGNGPLDAVGLHLRTGGNAFFVTEIIAAGDRELPGTVREAVLARVGRLSPEARRVAESVSIAPRSLELERAIVLAGADGSAVDEAVGAGVVMADGHALRFRHELARAAVESSIPPGRRLGLHRQMLSLLAEDVPPDLARLAHHAVETGDPSLILEYAPRAAKEAVERGSRKEAISLYRSALANIGEANPAQAAEMQLGLASELRLVDDPAASLIEIEQAIDYYRRVDEPARLADSLLRFQEVLWHLNRIPESGDAIDEALAILRPLGTSEDLARALYTAAHHHMLARHRDLAQAAVDEAVVVAEQSGSSDVSWLIHMIAGTIEIVVGDPAQGEEMLRQSWADATRAGNPRFVELSLAMLGSGGGEARRYEVARWALEEGVEHGLATDEDYSVSYVRSWLARIGFEQGRWDEAVEYAELVDRTTLNREGIAMLTASGALGRVKVRRGDPDGSALLERTIETGRDNELQHVWSPICGLAEHHWLTGNVQAMEPILSKAFLRALDTDSPWARGELGFWMWKAGAIDLAPDEAAEAFALQINGDWRAAASEWRRIGCPYEVALSLSEGDSDAQLEAVSMFDSMGARPAADLFRSRLRGSGVEGIPRRPSRATSANPAGLTDRQHEVLQLVIGGLSNAEIADRLYLSSKTVEHHVSAILTKLGVSTRAKAVQKATSLGINGELSESGGDRVGQPFD